MIKCDLRQPMTIRPRIIDVECKTVKYKESRDGSLIR